jgi:VIT1/CCC1 family predicted Fe2+/Mn2+ transporter
MELTAIYVSRGLDQQLAQLVAEKLTFHDALGAHAREELGINETLRARPIQAACTSALSFVAGAVIPMAATFLAPTKWVTEVSVATAILTLIILGGTAAYAGGASVVKGAVRVAAWGTLAMGITALVGSFFGTAA